MIRSVPPPEPASHFEMEDYDYIIRIIQYLDYRWGIRFFISTRDFDVLYKWWERKIPLAVIQEAISSVVSDWRKKGKSISGFSNFSYRVKKRYQSFLQLHVGSDQPEETDTYHLIDIFFQNYPSELAELKEDFQEIFRCVKSHEDFTVDGVYRKLLALFISDRDLYLKTRFFMESIARELRTPEMEQRYRINYLLHKYKIPDFEAYQE